MSLIKEIYDVTKDAAGLKNKIGAIKRALKTELKLNKRCMSDIEKSRNIDTKRRRSIINMLEITELSAACKLELPYKLISGKKVSAELAEELKIKRITGYNLEKLIEQLYLMISYIKKDMENENLDLNSRLIFIYKYNQALIKILS